MLIIGVDVGGTNTDCVILQHGTGVIASAKAPTTKDVTSGILNSVSESLKKIPSKSISKIQSVMIGTTHFVNAIVERSNKLAKVAAFRITGPSTRSIPPFHTLPEDFRDVIYGYHAYIDGGHEYDGSEIRKLNESQVVQECAKIKQLGITNVVLTALFSPILNSHEKQVEAIINRELPNVSVTLSSDISQIGILERENASILNASLIPLARETTDAFKRAFGQLNLTCPVYLTQNDGTLISLERVQRFPILTFASGPTNSMRGAAYLSGIKDAIVVDIGGTTTDVGVIVNGFPELSSTTIQIGGVSTRFRIPNVHSVALGGGSVVDVSQDGRVVQVGPSSVGYDLVTKGLVFGGDTLTAADVVVARNSMSNHQSQKQTTNVIFGDPSKVNHLSEGLVNQCMSEISRKIEDAIEYVKTSAKKIPLVLVGGGSILVPDTAILLQSVASAVHVPKYFEVANAVGAAIAQISGEVDSIVQLTPEKRETELKKLEAQAREKAIEAGADPDTVNLLDRTEVPIGYVPGSFFRVIVKVVGDLKVTDVFSPEDLSEEAVTTTVNYHHTVTSIGQQPEATTKASPPAPVVLSAAMTPVIDHRPIIKNGEWLLTERDIDYIGLGCGVLGTGGGGAPTISSIVAKKVLRDKKVLRVRSAASVTNDDVVISVGFMGAPYIQIEKIMNTNEVTSAVIAIQKATGKQATAITVSEIGGMNGITPIYTAGMLDLPVIDADGFSRAFPEAAHWCPFIYECSIVPTAICDDKGNALVMNGVDHYRECKQMERMMRALTVAMGLTAGIVFPPLDKLTFDKYMFKNMMSYAWRIGKQIVETNDKSQVVKQTAKALNGQLIFQGKIVDVSRSIEDAFQKGILTLEGVKSTPEYAGSKMAIHFQNEFLVAYRQEEVVVCTPDYIVAVLTDSGIPLQTEELKYGLKVSILAAPAHPLLLTEHALGHVGPKYFGYDIDRSQIKLKLGEYKEPMSVFEEYQ